MRFLTLILVAALTVPTFATAESRRLITVSGEGRVDVAPDMALVTLGVTSEAKTTAAAMGETSEKMTALLAYLEGLGIDGPNVQTNQLSLHPRYDSRSSGPAVISGYVATNTVSVRLLDLDQAGVVLDGVLESGANQFQGLQFTLQDDSAARDEARRRAVADARARAELYAEAAGVGLGPLMTLTEAGGHNPQPMVMMESAMRGGDVMPIAEGELSIVAQVTMVYEIVAE